MNIVETACPICHSLLTDDRSDCPSCGFQVGAESILHSGTTVILSTEPSSAAADWSCWHQPLEPGQSLARGRYTVRHALSRGGMGAIYLATDHGVANRSVVIKAMLDYFDLTNPDEARAAHDRFFEEARTLASLRHPAVPQIYNYFRDGLHNYIVMEYIDGPNLAQSLSHADAMQSSTRPGRPYAQAQVVQWGIAVCRVLEYLAGRQPHPVIHHDIKPANLLLDRKSLDIRLVDFGTARYLIPAHLSSSDIYGTAGYCPPEQYRGQSEPRSDVYALAATLYHLATDDDPGHHPFVFPQINGLGLLGKILVRALDEDVTRRPDATRFRQSLEAWLKPPLAAPAIEAPDGSPISNERELAHGVSSIGSRLPIGSMAHCLGRLRPCGGATSWLSNSLSGVTSTRLIGKPVSMPCSCCSTHTALLTNDQHCKQIGKCLIMACGASLPETSARL
ncbi:MAG: serine/threonine protein kinase [Chloroflexaceae bacterium]|nr:serine/threonine protein kinase [Chloroflexaceae bacterium]